METATSFSQLDRTTRQKKWQVYKITTLLPNTSSCAPHTVRTNKLKHEMSEFGAEKCLLQNHTRRQMACVQKAPISLNGCSKALLQARLGEVGRVVSCYKLLGVETLCSCSCPRRSGQDVPVKFQHMLYSVLQLFISI